MEVRVPWSAKAEKEDRTGQPVVGSDTSHESVYHHKQFVESSFSARYSGWDDDKAWSSPEWKADELMDDRTGETRCPLLHTSSNQVSLMRRPSTSFWKKKKLMIERGHPLSALKEKQCHSNSSLERRNRIGIVVRIQIILG